MNVHTTVWGIGNPLLKDDGAGPEVVRLLDEMGLDWLSARSCELAPGNYLATLKREAPRRFILVDASDMRLPPGSARRGPLSRIDSPTFTSHDLPLDVLLENALPAGCESFVIAIQPESTDFNIGLSAAVETAVNEVARLIAAGRTDEIAPLED